MSDEKLPDDILWHQSGVNPRGEPFIQLLCGTEIVCQMSPEQARDHARAIIEAAEAAESDAFMMHFLQERIGLDFMKAGMVLVEFREFRRAQTGKQSGASNRNDWVMPQPDKMPDYGDLGDITKRNPKA